MIWITGATGYLGSRIVRRLAHRGREVRCLVLPTDGAESPDEDSVTVVHGDLTRFESFAEHGLGVEAIVHCGALMLPNPADRIARVNIDGTENMIRFAKRWGVSRFVYISAVSAVYANKNTYGRSKAEAERLVMESGLDYTILRPTMIYGDGGGLHFMKLVRMIQRVPAVLPVLGRGTARLQPVWIDDAVGAVELVLSRPVAVGKTYNVSGATVVTFDELVDRIMAAAEIRRMKIHVPLGICRLAARLLAVVSESPTLSPDALLGINQDAALDYAAFAEECGYEPLSLEQGLARAFVRAQRTATQAVEAAPGPQLENLPP